MGAISDLAIAAEMESRDASELIVFGTPSDQGMRTMTESGIEFVLCASALTAQM